MKKLLKHPKLGDIIINRQTNFRRLSLKVNQRCEIILNIPQHITTETALEFLESNEEWIITTKAKFRAKAQKAEESGKLIDRPKSSEELNSLMYRAYTELIPRAIELAIKHGFAQSLPDEKPNTIKNALLINPKHTHLQQYEDYIFIAQFKKFTLKNNKSNWGSCSSTGNINLNINLIQLPRHLQDYIILHELCHLEEMNHGIVFHTLLEIHLQKAELAEEALLQKEISTWKLC